MPLLAVDRAEDPKESVSGSFQLQEMTTTNVGEISG